MRSASIGASMPILLAAVGAVSLWLPIGGCGGANGSSEIAYAGLTIATVDVPSVTPTRAASPLSITPLSAAPTPAPPLSTVEPTQTPIPTAAAGQGNLVPNASFEEETASLRTWRLVRSDGP